jgi:hypothetical protein
MRNHTIFRQVRDYLLGLQHHGRLFQHFATESLGQLLTLRIYLWFERVSFNNLRFAEGLCIQAIVV